MKEKRKKGNVWNARERMEMHGRKENEMKKKDKKCMEGKRKRGNVWKERERKEMYERK